MPLDGTAKSPMLTVPQSMPWPGAGFMVEAGLIAEVMTEQGIYTASQARAFTLSALNQARAVGQAAETLEAEAGEQRSL